MPDASPITILVTGLGVVSPLGVGREAFAQAVQTGKVGIGPLTLFEPLGACEHAAEVTGYDWKSWVFSKQTYVDRCTELTIGAARLALEDAGLALPVPEGAEPVGTCFGTCWGCIASAEKFYEPIALGKPKTVSSLVFSHSYANCPTSFAAIELGLRGYSTSFAGSPLAGLWALRSAVDALQQRTATRVLVGAADALSAIVCGHLEKTGALPDTRGQEPSAAAASLWARVPGEAAAFLFLETADSARGRGARAYAQLLSVREGGEPTSADWRCGDTQAAGPLLGLMRLLLALTADTRYGAAQGDESLTVALRPA